jgi:hypothetical protein
MPQTHHKPPVSIWFFIGCLLGVYGVLILGAGIADFSGGAHGSEVAMPWLHLQVWWGVLLIAMGAFYAVRFRPGGKHS